MTSLGAITKRPAIVMLAAILLGAATLSFSSDTSAVTECPIAIRAHGSTTVYPIAQGAEAQFEAARPGTDLQLAAIGSDNGLSELLAGDNEVATSSRPLQPAELAAAYEFPFALDGFVIAVQNSPEMDFLSTITTAQVEQIYEGTITHWDDGGLDGPHVAIVPRARYVGSGSLPDFLTQFGIDSSLESSTIAATALPRLAQTSDMANTLASNAYQIGYTSLGNLNVPGMKAVRLNGVAPNTSTVQNGFYPALRLLRLAVAKTESVDRIDSSRHVLADDFVNFLLSDAGHSVVVAQGFVAVPAPPQQPIPDWDVNLDGSTTLSDLGAVVSKWGESSSCPGWVRADVDDSGKVSLFDLGRITARWGGPGFVPPN